MRHRDASLWGVLLGVVWISTVGCSAGGRDPLAATTANGAGQITAIDTDCVAWRRRPLSLKLLGRLIERRPNEQTPMPPAVVRWASRNRQADQPADAAAPQVVSDWLLGQVSPADRSPAGHATSGH